MQNVPTELGQPGGKASPKNKNNKKASLTPALTVVTLQGVAYSVSSWPNYTPFYIPLCLKVNVPRFLFLFRAINNQLAHAQFILQDCSLDFQIAAWSLCVNQQTPERCHTGISGIHATSYSQWELTRAGRSSQKPHATWLLFFFVLFFSFTNRCTNNVGRLFLADILFGSHFQRLFSAKHIVGGSSLNTGPPTPHPRAPVQLHCLRCRYLCPCFALAVT